MTRLVSWVQTNQGAMIRADHGVADAQRALSDLERRVRLGLADGREAGRLGESRRAVSRARAACLALCEQAGGHAVGTASEGVRSRWRQASGLRGVPVELRHLSGMDRQVLRDRMRSAPSRDSGGRGLASVLTGSERRELEAVRGRIRSHQGGVMAAESRVLPVPAALREDGAGTGLADDEAGGDG